MEHKRGGPSLGLVPSEFDAEGAGVTDVHAAYCGKRSGFPRCAAQKSVSSFGRNDGSLFEWERTDNSKGRALWLVDDLHPTHPAPPAKLAGTPIAECAMDGAPEQVLRLRSG